MYKYLLFLATERFSAHRWEKGRLTEEQVFSHDAAGRERFDSFLRQHGKDPLYLLTDLVEEDYRFDTVPHLVGPDHSALMERKLEQFYRNTPLRYFQVQGREETGRKDDRVLFSALTNPSLITPWLDLLRERAVPLKGIYTVPLISRQLFEEDAPPHFLLLTWQKHTGLRQSYFTSSGLSFSRLTPITERDSLVEKVRTESERTYQYLNSLSLLPLDQPLDIYIVCGSADKQELQAQLKDSREARYVFMEIGHTATRLGFHGNLQGSDALPLFLHILASSSPPNQFANAGHTHFYSLWQIRRAVIGLTAATAVVTAAWAGITMWQAAMINQGIESLRAQAQTISSQYQSITKTFPKTPTSTDSMKAAVSTLSKLAAFSPQPRQFLPAISGALAEFPLVQLTALSWHTTFNPEAVRSDFSVQAASAPAAPAAPPPAAGAAPAPADVPHRVLFLRGEISPFDNNYRNALDYVSRFQQALEKTGASVTALTLPLDLRPEASVTSDTDQSGRIRRAVFSLKIVWRLSS